MTPPLSCKNNLADYFFSPTAFRAISPLRSPRVHAPGSAWAHLACAGTMAAAVATAESALRAEMVARGDGADADDTIARIRDEPARFKDRQNALGELARKLIEKADQDARMDVDPVVIDTPPRPGRSSSTAVEVDVSRLSKGSLSNITAA